jgi:hypothetical protein
MKMKWEYFVTKDGVNLYELFNAGIRFGETHVLRDWTPEEWVGALEQHIPKEALAEMYRTLNDSISPVKP